MEQNFSMLTSPSGKLLFVLLAITVYNFFDLHMQFIFTDASCLMNMTMPHTTCQKST